MLEKELSPKARNLMCREVIEQNQPISTVAKKYEVSRVTLYKWLKRYKEDLSKNLEPDMSSKEPEISKYWHQAPEEYEEAVLSLVNQHPEWGIRTLVKNLPKVGNTPIVGHHGVQNILRRNNLSTYEDRLAYVKSLRTPVIRSIEDILKLVTGFFQFPAEKRQNIIRLSGITLLSSFVTIVILGFVNYISVSFSGEPISSKIGAIFASTALVMGSFFFLYSLKYYLTLAIVLSYSQKEANKDNKQSSKGNFFDWILGNNNLNSINNTKAVGLEPDLKRVNLKNKPFISVQIPFYNEKYVVERSIHAAISFDYPAYEVILCDDSTDETTEIIKKRMERYLNVGEKLKTTKGEGFILTEIEVKPGVILKHLHRTTRSGFKGGALDLALKLSDPRTEFVSVFDADFVPYPDSLELFLKYLKVQNNMSEDYSLSNVAAVQGYQWHVLNKSENWITRGVRSEYSGSYVIERSGAEIYGGLKQISGSVYMIRKDVLTKMGWGTSITEDFELTLKLYQSGYKVVYTPYIQAPAECVSTLKRLVRQRMRWAEGHSFNIKKMFKKMFFNPKITLMEKLELTYLTPYYLQAFFFLVGTVSWLISEAIFRTRLPFWTEFWGWSLVLTNMISLPLLNSVGLFLEESEERDYLGLGSFIALSYILVPFQAYAAVKGFLEKEEGTWFRTPKTGRITDTFMRGKFYRFISGIIPGKNQTPVLEENYLALSTANNKFSDFNIKNIKNKKWLGKTFLSFLLILTVTVYHFSYKVAEVEASTVNNYYLALATTDEDTSSTSTLYNSGSWQKQGAVVGGTDSTLNNATGTYWFYSRLYPTSTGDASVAAGTYYYNFYVSRNGTGGAIAFVYTVEVGYCDNADGIGDSCSSASDYHVIATSNTITYLKNVSLGLHNETIGTGTALTFKADNKARMYTKLVVTTNASWVDMGLNGSAANYISNLQTPNLITPEGLLLFLVVAPFIPMFVMFLKKKKLIYIESCE